MGALVEYNRPMGLPSPHARLGNTNLQGRLASALRSTWLPLALLLIALSTVFIFGGDRGHFYRCCIHNWISSQHLTVAANISPEHGFQRFTHRFIDEDGAVRYEPYNRFPIGGYLSMKLATLPFGGSPSAQIAAARILMLLFFSGAALLAYLSLCRLASNRWIALTATLLAFSSYYLLYNNDMTANEGMPDLFAVMMTFHGMVVFVQEGRFRQLLVKTCIALLIGWHVLALLLPFVIFGLAREIIRARSAATDSHTSSLLFQGKRAVSALLRSRYLLLGIVALALAMATLTFNFTMEYIALGGETPLTELPSFESMLKRTGQNSDYNERNAPIRSWSPFLEVQFRSVLRMFIPYPLLGFRPVGYFSNVDVYRYPTWLSGFQGVALGIALTAASLIGSMFVRQRILFATLASFGFFWALPMRNNTATAYHDFETMYYIGLPLVFFTLILLLARRLTRRDGVIAAAAVGALLLFAISSFQMSRFGYSPEAAQAARNVEQDLLAIHKLVAGEPVTVRNSHDIQDLSINVLGYATYYYLNSILVDKEYYPSEDRGFIVMHHRVDADSLLTPENRHFFLYNGPDLIASYRSTYQYIVSNRAPAAREDFDVYVNEGRVHYVKEPCQREDTRARFSLHVFPENLDDLPDNRKQYRFDNLDFRFTERGVMFDGKCLLRVNLPKYDIAGIRTARLHGDGHTWIVAHVIQGPKLIAEYPSTVSREPAARSEFDLYLDGGNLYYVKEPCGSEDVQAGFFLHIVPTDLDDLPDHRSEYGFDNLDFGFDVRGVLFDGKCAASVDLPQYAIARITTGQYDGAGRIWMAEIDLEANE